MGKGSLHKENNIQIIETKSVILTMHIPLMFIFNEGITPWFSILCIVTHNNLKNKDLSYFLLLLFLEHCRNKTYLFDGSINFKFSS